ncbi:potassium voltage-gated channel subfamily H member 6 isoform X3 [Bradysia coprophila]|uniref:potassium voltage-gated channel subfamily H member 6 isoform X3 n=1 Tax=Bradysia coprophila TaxID=38358 RepID=UPI00187DD0E7|nr:potassium voltage-gated channel subfamily H member 6 isoform X3 [Bradysia coprophila]
MPVRRGHVAPKTTLIETIIRKFDTHNRSFLVANAQSETFHIIFCSDGFCKMTGFTRAEVMQRASTTEFLHGPMTSQQAVNLIKDALSKGFEKHFEILYYRKNGQKFLCSEVIAPIRSEIDDISLFIINFEDLTNPAPAEPIVAARLSKFDRARASFRTKFGSMGLRDRGLRLAGYLTPPSDVTQEEEEANECINSMSHPTLQKIESGKVWSPMTTPTLMRSAEQEKIRDSLRLEDLKIATPKKPQLVVKKSEFSHTKSLDFDAQSKHEDQAQIQSKDSSNAKAKNCRGLIQKRAHTLDDFMTGQSGHTSRQFFPYVSSESDLQHYKTISFRHSHNHEHRTSSSLSNVPSDFRSDRIKDNGSAKYFQGTRHTPNMGEKVAQVLSLGADVLPEYKLQSPRIHRWTVLHYSPFKAVWDWIILILVMYTAIFTPYVAAFLLGETDYNQTSNYNQKKSEKFLNASAIVIIDLVVDVTFVIDILINFRTTFVNGQDEVVSHPGRIAVHYLSGWFLIDLVAAIPFDLLLVNSDTEFLFLQLGLDKDETTTLIGLLKTARLLRLVRVARKIDRYSEYGAAVLVLLMATFALIAHWLACIWYAIGNAQRPMVKIGWLDILANDTQEHYFPNNTGGGPSIKSRYITALYFTFTTLTSVGFGNVAPNTDPEKIFTICVMLVGSLMYASIFGNVSAIIQRLYSGTARYHTQMLRVREFIRFHQIPNPLRQRLEEYFQHAWTYTNGIDMNSVLKGFPECLQADICLHLNRNLLESCSAFDGASPGCLRALSLKFKTTHAPPGDTLVHKGDVLTSLYFIARGSIEILKDDVVMAILGKDDIFGENPCIHSTLGKSNSNVRALTYCDLHKIHRDDLLDVLDLYPEFYDCFVNNLEITFNMRDEEQAGVEIRHRFMRSNSKESDKNSDTRSYRLTLHTRQHSHEQPTDKLLDNETEGEPKHRYSISEVITQIKRSIPDLRSIKHQPLENSATSPCKSPGEDRPLLQNQLGTHADAVTLSAITTTCSCGGGPKLLPRPNNQQADGVNEFQHTDLVDDPPIGTSSITNQISDLTVRIDHLELSLKKDIGTILDILHQQQQFQFHQQAGKPMAASYLSQPPSESDFSFDNMCAIEKQHQQQLLLNQQQQPQRTGIVQRSISQPECTNENEKSLLKCSKFSSFNQAMDDTDEWTVFAPIARLESLDELDQDSKHSNSQDKSQ